MHGLCTTIRAVPRLSLLRSGLKTLKQYGSQPNGKDSKNSPYEPTTNASKRTRDSCCNGKGDSRSQAECRGEKHDARGSGEEIVVCASCHSFKPLSPCGREVGERGLVIRAALTNCHPDPRFKPFRQCANPASSSAQPFQASLPVRERGGSSSQASTRDPATFLRY